MPVVLEIVLLLYGLKKGERLRMCTDYTAHMTDKNNVEEYPLPCIDTIFSRVFGAKLFAKIDLSKTYWQIAIDEKSHEACNMNKTPLKSYPAPLRTGKCSSYISTSNRRNVELIYRMPCLPRWYLPVPNSKKDETPSWNVWNQSTWPLMKNNESQKPQFFLSSDTKCHRMV